MDAGAGQDLLDALGSANRHGALLHDDLVSLGDLGDLAGTELAVLDVGGAACGVDQRELRDISSTESLQSTYQHPAPWSWWEC